MAKKFYAPALRSGEMVSREVKKFYVPYLTNDQLLSKKVIKAYCSVVRNGEHVSRLFYEAGGSTEGWRQETNIPYTFRLGSAVVFNNKIHLLGGENITRYHYTFDGSTWTRETDLPFDFYNGSAIAFGGKIHCFGGNGTESQYYTYDGSTWTHETDLPDTWTGAFSHHYFRIQGLNHATIYNGKLTLACSNFDSNGDWRHIATLNNGSWSVNWNVLGDSIMYSAVGYNNLIYLLGDSGTGGTKYNTWNGSSQSAYSPLPYQFQYGYALEYKGNIHILGGSRDSKKHYSFDGTTFTAKADIPYNGFSNCPAVVYNDRIHIFGSSTNHWSFGKESHWVLPDYTPQQTYTLDATWDVEEFITDAINKWVKKNENYTQSPEIFSQISANMATIVSYLSSFKGNRTGVAIKFATGIAYEKLWMLTIQVQYVNTPMSLLITNKQTASGETYYKTQPFVAAAYIGEPSYDVVIHMGGLPIDYTSTSTGTNVNNIGYRYDYFSNYGFYELIATNVGMVEE